MISILIRLTVLVALLVSVLPIGLSAPRAAHAGPTPPAGSWPFFRYDMQRTNRVPSSVAKGNITQPALKWSFPVGGAASATAADITGPNGTPDGVPEIIAWGGGRVRAYDSQTGNPLWISELFLGPSIQVVRAGDVDGDTSAEVLVYTRLGTGGVDPSWRLFVLSGATGQVRSQISGYAFLSNFFTPFLADANGDGKLELFERGWRDPNYQIFSFQSADSPIAVATITNALGSLTYFENDIAIADLDGDAVSEVLFASSYAGSGNTLFCNDPCHLFYIMNPATWSIVVTYPASLWTPITFPRVVVTDVLTGNPGSEIFGSWVTGSGNRAHVALFDVGSGYVITPQWVYTRTSVVNLSTAHPIVVNLDGTGDPELIWAYRSTTDNEWRTEVLNAGGVPLATLVAHSPYAAANVAAGGGEELVLLQTSGTVVTGVAVYSGTGVSLAWSAPVSSVVGLADFDGDGLRDLVVVDGVAPNQAIKVRRGHDGAVLHTHTPGQYFGMRYVGDLDATPATPEVLYAGDDGYLYYLDRTLAIRRRVYAGAGTVAPYVVDTNSDGKNEVIFDRGGRLFNLDPTTATQQAPPSVNWVWRVDLPNFWHPLNLDGDAVWEYLVVDSAQAPTYTLRLMTKNPLNGAEGVLASYTITNAPAWPHLMAVGQFDGSGPEDLIVSSGFADAQRYAIAWPGGSNTNFNLIWSTPQNRDRPFAVGGDLNGDARDDFAGGQGFSVGIVNGSNGSFFNSQSIYWDIQPILANLDGDSVLEALFSGSDPGRFHVREFTVTASPVFTRDVSGVPAGAVAVADVSNAPGLEIVYGAPAVLGAMSGVNGSDIYTRGLGVAFNTGTCESSPNVPVSYPGNQVALYESACPGAMRLANINEVIVADIDNDNKDEILAASANGYLYALNAEDGSLRWAYNFHYPVSSVRAANLDADNQLEVLVSVADGFLYALEQQSFAKPQSAWDGPSAIVNDDIDVQTSRLCYSGHWRATSDPGQGQPQGYRVALRDEGGALVTDGYLDVAHTPGANVMGVTLCYNDPNPQRRLAIPLTPGRRYYLEVISYKGANASAPTFSDMVRVAATGNLELSSKAATPATTVPGGVITWTITVRNTGLEATQASVIDPIPLNTSYVPGSAVATVGTVSYDGATNRILWQSGAPLGVNQAAVITFATQVDGNFVSGIIRNEALVIDQETGLQTRVTAQASVGASNLGSAEKTASLAQANLGDVITYTIRLTNTGTLTASGTLIEDTLPSSVVYQAGSLSSSGGSGVASYSNVLKQVTWTGNLGPGQSVMVTFAAKVNVANAIVDNCAVLRDVQNGSFTRCARTVVGSGAASLAGSLKTSDRITYTVGDQITYTISLNNSGTQNATVTLDDPMPAGVTVNYATVNPNTGSLFYTAGRVQWNGTVSPGSTVVVTIRATVSGPDRAVKNTAVVTDTVSGQVYRLEREVLVGLTPLINAEKFAEPASVDAGEEITYVMRLENAGNAVASSAVLSDPLPVGTSYVPGSAAANLGVVSYNASAQRLEWSGPIYLTQTTVITWRVKVEANALPGSVIVNRAYAYDGVSDSDEMAAVTAVNIPAGKALIRGYVYSGTGTTPLPGVLLSAAGLATVSRNTDASGYAALLVDAQVTPTNYVVHQVVPAGYVNLTPNPVGVPGVVEGGLYDVVFRDALAAPFGYGWVRGVVFNDANGDGLRNIFSEVGLAGVTVQASTGASMQTLGDGSYFFLLPAGSRTITQTNLAGWVSTTPDVVPVTVASQGAHEVNFGDQLCQGLPTCYDPPDGFIWLQGYVYRDADAVLNAPDGLKGAADVGLSSVGVNALVGTWSASANTDGSGFYYMQIPRGPGQVTVTLPAGYIALTPEVVSFDASDVSLLRVDFAVISATQCGTGAGVVHGYVYSDTAPVGQFVLGQDGPTLSDATVGYGGQTQQTNWMYAFVCVPAGSGVVTSTNPAGYTNTTPNSVNVTVVSGETASANFGKAFVQIPLTLRYAYMPIVYRPGP
jgi:uncharacterized repeat protein (TIGR01451 family)